MQGSPMLLASLNFRVQPYKKAEALSAVDALVQRMRLTSGCARSRVLNDMDDAYAFMIASEWAEPAAAEAFFASREFQIFLGIRILLRDEPLIVLDDIRSRITRLMRAEGSAFG
jgi:quinol monooxygenase YgiN